MTKYVICVDIGCEDIQTPYLSVFFLFLFFFFDFSWHNRLSNIAKLLQHVKYLYLESQRFSSSSSLQQISKLVIAVETSQQETVKSFDNSGVIVHFNDHESLPLEFQGVRSEISWDEALCINLLNDDEVQLSPVVEFQPHGSRLSNPVRVRIPHSALLDSSHGWSIGLKSSALSGEIGRAHV